MSQAEIQAIQAELDRRAEVRAIEAELARRQTQAAPQQPGAVTPNARSTAPGTTPEEAARLPEGLIYDEQTGGYVDTALDAERMGRGRGLAAEYLAGTPFIGEFVDEGLGRVDSLVTGRNPEIAQETFRQARQQIQESSPGQAMAANLAGGVAGAAAPVMQGARAVSAVTGALPKAVTAVGLGTLAGAADGAARGYGRGTTQRDRTEKALGDGLFGAGAGATFSLFGLGLGYTAGQLAKRLRGVDTKTISKELGVSPEAAQVVKRHLINDDLEAAQAALDRAGPNAMLADAGPGTRQLLDTAAASGGAPLRVTREAVEGRAAAAGGELTRRLNAALGKPRGVRRASQAIARRSAPRRKQAYDAAYAAPIDYSGAAGREIEGVLSRVPPNTLNRAIGEANDAMREAGETNLQIMARIGDDGSVAFSEMPNVRQLDELKQALQEVARGMTDPKTGRMTKQGVRAQRLAKDLRDAVGRAVPDYRRAVKLGGDKIAEEIAYDTGNNLFSNAVTLEDVGDAMRGASADAKAAARQGLRQNMEDLMSRVRRTITDDNTDAREAMAALKMVSSRDSQAKLKLILGDSGADRFLKAFDEASAALELRAAVSRNSATAIRQAGQDSLEELFQAGPIGALRDGQVMGAAEQVIGALMGGNSGNSAAREVFLTEVAKILTETRGPEARRAITTIRRALAGQPVTEVQARKVAEAVGAATATLGLQTQALNQGQ